MIDCIVGIPESIGMIIFKCQYGFTLCDWKLFIIHECNHPLAKMLLDFLNTDNKQGSDEGIQELKKAVEELINVH